MRRAAPALPLRAQRAAGLHHPRRSWLQLRSSCGVGRGRCGRRAGGARGVSSLVTASVTCSSPPPRPPSRVRRQPRRQPVGDFLRAEAPAARQAHRLSPGPSSPTCWATVTPRVFVGALRFTWQPRQPTVLEDRGPASGLPLAVGGLVFQRHWRGGADEVSVMAALLGVAGSLRRWSCLQHEKCGIFVARPDRLGRPDQALMKDGDSFLRTWRRSVPTWPFARPGCCPSGGRWAQPRLANRGRPCVRTGRLVADVAGLRGQRTQLASMYCGARIGQSQRWWVVSKLVPDSIRTSSPRT